MSSSLSVPLLEQWQLLSDKFYCKEELYSSMDWGEDVELAHLLVACAANGGPIALTRDPRQVIPVSVSSPLSDPSIHVYTSAGGHLSAIHWSHSGGRLVKMGWLCNDTLVCVTEDGFVYLYGVMGELRGREEMGPECWEQGVADAFISSRGLVCVTDAGHFFHLLLLSGGKEARKLPVPPHKAAPSAVAVIEKDGKGKEERSVRQEDGREQEAGDENVAVVIAFGSTVMCVGRRGIEHEGIPIGPVLKMAASPSGKLLGCFTHEGRLLVLPSDLSQIILDFDTENVLPPDEFAWCGEDAIALHWADGDLPTYHSSSDPLSHSSPFFSSEVQFIGPGGSIRFTCENASSLVLIPEADSLRILSSHAMEIVRKVPECLVSVFGIGSTSPAALLLESFHYFRQKSIRADESIRAIGAGLEAAVVECIESAAHDFSAERQALLLRAAAYGRAFCRSFPKEKMRETCLALRVLNAIRPSNGPAMPLTYPQFQEVSAEGVVRRLASTHHHLLALRIAKALHLPTEALLEHWASSKVASAVDVPDDDLHSLLISKLKEGPRVSYALIAESAFRHKRANLAAMLLEGEARAARAVVLLLKMGQEEVALARSVRSLNPDILLSVLFHLLHMHGEEVVMRLLQSEAYPRQIFTAFAKEDKNHHDLLKRFYKLMSQPQRVAELIAREALEKMGRDKEKEEGGEGKDKASSRASMPQPKASIHFLDVQRAAELFGQSRDSAFHSKMADDHAKLLRFQQQLESATVPGGHVERIVGRSLTQTLRLCIESGNERDATRLKNDFKIPDKRFHWVKLRSLAKKKNWEAVEKFSKERRPPIGFRPFVEVCMEEGAKSEAAKYIPKISDATEREELYKRLGMENEAAEAANQAREGVLGSLRSTIAGQTASTTALFDSFRNLSLPSL